MNTSTKLVKKIRAATASATARADAIEKAAQAARVERARRDAQAQEQAKQQAALDARLDTAIEQAMGGAQAILKLSNTLALRKLIAARASINKKTTLYEVSDHCMAARVSIAKRGFRASLFAELPSSCQGSGKLIKYESCIITHLFRRGRELPQQWFYELYTHDPYFDWSPMKDFVIDLPQDRRVSAEEYDLHHLEKLDLEELRKKIEKMLQEERIPEEADGHYEPLSQHDAMRVNHVLLRFLMDCNDRDKLQKYLEQAAAREFE